MTAADRGDDLADHPKADAIRRYVRAHPDAEPSHVLAECNLGPDMIPTVKALLGGDELPEADAPAEDGEGAIRTKARAQSGRRDVHGSLRPERSLAGGLTPPLRRALENRA